ncbi:Protein PIN-LIKES 2 [Golovinomyces cichoracearum]|uniref:Protein PIN-LIKES 2 n=1 Tax=Golovinomyces cichoracearum TaxID=62708 RepID=A0A420HPF4_9PEZI|nr:Protein PIN-LIKES 2 [Golovinomyces cichoracearum]
MGLFEKPASYRLNSLNLGHHSSEVSSASYSFLTKRFHNLENEHADLGHLILLVFEASMEVVCVSLPGYIIARRGMFSAEHQKFLANLNVALFTPCLIFTKLASQLNAEKLLELAVIPVVFFVQTVISYLVSIVVSKSFGFQKRPSNFVTAMGVFGNSNSLPISLVISLSQTLKGLHWDKIPGDNDEEVAARGILYLLIFQQLGQLLRWSWGYYVLLAPPEKSIEDLEQGNEIDRYCDDPELVSALDSKYSHPLKGKNSESSTSTTSLRSDNKIIITKTVYTGMSDSDDESIKTQEGQKTPPNVGSLPSSERVSTKIISFPSIRSPSAGDEQNEPSGYKKILSIAHLYLHRLAQNLKQYLAFILSSIFASLPRPLQKTLLNLQTFSCRFLANVWEFMNPPLWAMLSAIIVASIPKLQHTFFADGTFISNTFTRAVSQSGGVAVPLILVVLGANLARNTLPQESLDDNSEESRIGKKLLIASLLARMVFPALIMAPLLALTAKYIPVSIVDDPIFVVVCFLLTGAPSALQLAQICQINGVYERVMSKLLFHSYVVWIFPSTLFLVTCALEVVRWANTTQ